MNKFIPVAVGCVVLATFSCGTTTDRADTPVSTSDSDSASVTTDAVESPNSVRNDLPLGAQALLNVYPDLIVGYEGNHLLMADGSRLLYDDGRVKNHTTRLDDCDVEDMFYTAYAVTDSEPEFQYDPGRSRSDRLFKAMYGNSAAAVQRNLETVDWFGQRVKFISLNGAADSLRAVAREIAQYPELRPYLKSSGTFYWRPVRGANRLSAHSYGIAFDIGVEKSDYWQWRNHTTNENQKIKYANRIPRRLVDIFERHGFIWGGAWYHYDTMHFEFRPELLEYARLTRTAR